jgi:hypothetical protein
VALVLRVGTTADVFTEPFASHLADVLENHFGLGMKLSGTSDDEGWCSVELGWSYLRQLQEHAQSLTLPVDLPHLLSMPAWRGAFLPVETATGELSDIWEPDEPIAICSLLALDRELRLLAPAMDVPLDPVACTSLIDSYLSDDDRVDDDPEIQMLTQLVIGTSVGLSRRQPLWVVK